MEESTFPENVTWWNKITHETADLALGQVSTLLQETVETASAIQDKSDKLIGLIVPIFAAIVAYSLSDFKNWKDILHLTAIVVCGVLCLSLIYLYNNIEPYSIRTCGNEAKTYLNNDWIVQ